MLTALLRRLGTDDEAAAIRVKLNASYAEILATLTERPDAALRADLVLAWLFGISFMRGVAATEPLAGADGRGARSRAARGADAAGEDGVARGRVVRRST